MAVDYVISVVDIFTSSKGHFAVVAFNLMKKFLEGEKVNMQELKNGVDQFVAPAICTLPSPPPAFTMAKTYIRAQLGRGQQCQATTHVLWCPKQMRCPQADLNFALNFGHAQDVSYREVRLVGRDVLEVAFGGLVSVRRDGLWRRCVALCPLYYKKLTFETINVSGMNVVI